MSARLGVFVSVPLCGSGVFFPYDVCDESASDSDYNHGKAVFEFPSKK